jgi:hypothetical protein
MREPRDPINQLRNAIDRLPQHTREAMLDGIRTQPIVVGAYTDNDGGICPMLAAHRNGSRVDYLPFSRSWDAFARARRVRRATRRELRVLEDLLVASLEQDAPEVDLGQAIAEHVAITRARLETATEPEAAPEREFGNIVARRLRPGKTRQARDAEGALARFETLVKS